MAKWKKKNNPKKLSYISVPSPIINPITSSTVQSLLDSPKKYSRNNNVFLFSNGFPTKHSKLLCFFTLFLLSFLGILMLVPFSTYPCAITLPNLSVSSGYNLKSELGVISSDGYASKSELEAFSSENGRRGEGEGEGDEEEEVEEDDDDDGDDDETGDSELWKQPDGLGYRPCLDFSKEFRRESESIVKQKRKYLMVVVAGGLNQQRNQIVDAVVIARILGAALVVPILQVNVIWGDESEFGEIFDLEHFKRVLGDEVRVVSALPSTHLMTRLVEGKPPLHVTPTWIRSRYLKRLNREGVLLLRGLDSRLSKDLPPDLQKLRCKVAFHALRFAKPVEEIGNKIAGRMRRKGPYMALHLRMEKDVWVRTGCLPGLSPEYDEIIYNERIHHPELLTARSNITHHQRKLSGLCPLNAIEVSRLLKVLGASKSARIYWAGGKPLGGKEALLPIIKEFPHFYNKEDLALPGELEPFRNKASLMAAIDYIVSDRSDVFMPSHGGNMGHAIQGHRAYAGHKKYITPNKRQMISYFMNSSLPEAEFNRIIKELHKDSLGQPESRTSKAQRDVTKYPVPECMCNNDSHAPSFI